MTEIKEDENENTGEIGQSLWGVCGLTSDCPERCLDNVLIKTSWEITAQDIQFFLFPYNFDLLAQ